MRMMQAYSFVLLAPVDIPAQMAKSEYMNKIQYEHYMCFQIFLSLIELVSIGETLYSLAIVWFGSPSANRLRISKTCSSLSFANPDFDPLGLLPRFFFSLSRALSPWEPKNRCSGLLHGGLSQ